VATSATPFTFQTLFALCGFSVLGPAAFYGLGDAATAFGAESPLLSRFGRRGFCAGNFGLRAATSQQRTSLLQQCYFSIDLGKDFRDSHTSSSIYP
jgi:hypothetical protein